MRPAVVGAIVGGGVAWTIRSVMVAPFGGSR